MLMVFDARQNFDLRGRMRVRKPLAAIIAVLGYSQTACATATLTCDIDNSALTFSMQGAVGSNSSLNGVQARLELKGGEGLPKLGIDLNSENIVQRWIDGLDLRLRLQSPVDEPIVIDLVLKTRKFKEFEFSGRYRLTVDAGGEKQIRVGRVECTMG